MYVFIGLHCLLPEAAIRTEVFGKKGVLKNFVNFIGKHLCCSLFLIKLQAWHLFWRTSAKDCFYTAHTPLTVIYPFYFIFSTSITFSTQKQSSGDVLKKSVLTNFAKFTGKYLCQSLFFNKVAKLMQNFAKFLRTPFVTEHLWWLLLTTVNIFDVCFWFKFQKASNNLNLVSHFHWSHFHWCYFLFPCFFCLSQFCFIFSCRCS